MIPLLSTLLFLLVPGAAAGRAAGLRLVPTLTTAPVISVGLVALLTQVTALAGMPWSPWSFGALTLVTVLLIYGVRLLVRRSAFGQRLPWANRVDDEKPSRRLQLVVAAAPLVAGAIAAGVAVWGMGGLTGINQEFDVLFHVNAVQLITETHNADPAAIGAVNHYHYGSTYYPIAFHALAALTADLGVNSVVATNALVALIPASLCLGLTGLLWQLRLPAHAVVVPFVAISVAAFPTDLMWRGPLWPFAMGVALVPAFMALLVAAFDRGSRSSALLTVVAAAGLLALHPSAALAAAIFAACYFVQRWVRHPGGLRTDLLPLAVVTVATVVVSLPAVVVALANSGYGVTYDWPAVQTAGAAVGELLMFNYFAQFPQMWLFLLLVVGLVFVRRLAIAAWWLVASGVFVVLLALAAAYEGGLVALLTGPWWNDRFRFSALAVLGLTVLCAHGVVVLGGTVTGTLRRLKLPGALAGPAVGVLVVLVLFAVVSHGFYAAHNRERLQMKYAMGSGGSVTPGEVQAMDVLATLPDRGRTVMNDPGDGSAWMWALRGIRPMFGQAVTNPIRPPLEHSVQIAASDFHCIDSSPAVRQVVEQYDIHYVYVGQGFIFPNMHRLHGLQDVQQSRSLEVVFANDGATIYRIELQPLVPESADLACDTASESGG